MNITYRWSDIERSADKIIAQMCKDQWVPDYVVSVNPSGLVLGLLISQRLSIPLETLNVASEETNCWMSEDAFGYVDLEQQAISKSRWDISSRKNILVVDNCNNTGNTFNWIVSDWQSTCLPNEIDAWNSVWHKNVRFAVIDNNVSSEFEDVAYYVNEIGNSLDYTRVPVYPWEK